MSILAMDCLLYGYAISSCFVTSVKGSVLLMLHKTKLDKDKQHQGFFDANLVRGT